MKKLLLLILLNTFVPVFIISMDSRERYELEQIYELSRKLVKEKKYIQAKDCMEQGRNLIKKLTTNEQKKLNDFLSRTYYNAAVEYVKMAQIDNGKVKTEEEIQAVIEAKECLKLSLERGLDMQYRMKAIQMRIALVNYIFDLGVLFYKNKNILTANFCLNKIFFEKSDVYMLSSEKEQELGEMLQEINEQLKMKYS